MIPARSSKKDSLLANANYKQQLIFAPNSNTQQLQKYNSTSRMSDSGSAAHQRTKSQQNAAQVSLKMTSQNMQNYQQKIAENNNLIKNTAVANG